MDFNFLLVLNVLLDVVPKESAYLDPGSGSFILQILLASLVGIGFALRGYWSKIITKFRKTDALDDEDLDDDEDEE